MGAICTFSAFKIHERDGMREARIGGDPLPSEASEVPLAAGDSSEAPMQ